MSFYMTLPSDSSKNQFPNNTVGHYDTTLARNIALESSYEVGLSEMLLPPPKSAVRKMQYLSFVDLEKPDQGRVIIGIPPECFITLARFKRTLRKKEYLQFADIEYSRSEYEFVGIRLKEDKPKEKLPFTFTLKDHRVILTVTKNCELQFIAAHQMAKLFGFKNNKPYVAGAERHESYTGDYDYSGATNMDLLYVYCDIVEYGIVGDTLAPCLRTIPLTSRDVTDNDKAIVERFESPHYVPVQRNVFSTIQILIANDNGNEVHFGDLVAIIKLHFRPKKR